MFRIVLALMVLSAIVGAVVSFVDVSSLPPPLKAFVREGSGAALSRPALLAVGYAGSALAAVMVVGLFFFWKPARLLLLILWLLSLIISPFLGITVESPWATTLNGFSGVLEGIVIALVYFSPLAALFEGRERKQNAVCLNKGADVGNTIES